MKQRKKVLIINDELDSYLLMKAYLFRKNYEVCVAHTFNDALPIAKECRPDIILLTKAICQHLKEDIQKMKEAAPAAEIILDGFAL